MANVKFQGAAQRKGFSPINMNNQAPQRILQEANRVADGMRAEANAVLEDRNVQSRAMSENYSIQRDAENRNFDIMMGNMRSESEAAIGKINERAAATASMYQGLSKLSETAGKIATTIIESNQKKEAEETKRKFLTDPGYRDSLLKRWDSAMLENSAALTEANATAVSGELEGARPVEASRVVNSFRGFSAAEKYAVVDYKFNQFPAELQAELSGDREFFDPQTGQNFKGAEALADERLHAIASQAVLDGFMQKNGFDDLSLEFIAPALDRARKYMVKSQATAAKNEQLALDSEALFTVKQSILTTEEPTAVSSLVKSNKYNIWKANEFDYGKTARYFLEPAYATDAYGNYLMPEPARQALLNTPFGQNGETLGEYKALNSELQRKARVARIQTDREDRNIRELEGEEFWESESENMESIFAKGNAAEDQQAFNTFEAQYYEEFGDDVDLPEGYKRRKKEILNENKGEELELVEQATLGMPITMEQARSLTDPGAREAAIELIQKQEVAEYGGAYSDVLKTLKGYAKQLTGSDLSSNGVSPMGQLLVPELQADYKKYYDAELKRLSSDGKVELTQADYSVASQKAIEKLQQDVADGLQMKDGAKYSRKGDTANNLYEFPNLNLEERAAQARKRYGAAVKSYGTSGEKAFDTKGAILTDAQLNKTVDTYTRTGVLDIPPVVMKLSEISGELPVDILNRQIAASDNPNLEQIKPPSYYQKLKGESPAVISLFHNSTTIRQRARALAQLPDNLSQRMGTSDFDYLVNTIAGVESTSYGAYDAYNLGGSDGGHTAHGSGNSAKDKRFGKPISQLTIGEIRRLHNSRQLFATGRYQFIPGTFREVAAAAGLPDNTVFDKKTQDAFFLIRLRQRANFGMPLEVGLRQEWIGLQNLKEPEYRRVVEAARRLLAQ